MRPRYDEGDIILCRKVLLPQNLEDGWEAAVCLTSGQTHIKTIRRAGIDRVDLVSFNDDPIFNAKIAWAYKVFANIHTPENELR